MNETGRRELGPPLNVDGRLCRGVGCEQSVQVLSARHAAASVFVQSAPEDEVKIDLQKKYSDVYGAGVAGRGGKIKDDGYAELQSSMREKGDKENGDKDNGFMVDARRLDYEAQKPSPVKLYTQLEYFPQLVHIQARKNERICDSALYFDHRRDPLL